MCSKLCIPQVLVAKDRMTYEQALHIYTLRSDSIQIIVICAMNYAWPVI